MVIEDQHDVVQVARARSFDQRTGLLRQHFVEGVAHRGRVGRERIRVRMADRAPHRGQHNLFVPGEVEADLGLGRIVEGTPVAEPRLERALTTAVLPRTDDDVVHQKVDA